MHFPQDGRDLEASINDIKGLPGKGGYDVILQDSERDTNWVSTNGITACFLFDR